MSQAHSSPPRAVVDWMVPWISAEKRPDGEGGLQPFAPSSGLGRREVVGFAGTDASGVHPASRMPDTAAHNKAV
jgi:hypothetical protein